MFGWLFSPAPAVFEITPEERFTVVMKRLDAIEKAIEDLRWAVLGEEIPSEAPTEGDGDGGTNAAADTDSDYDDDAADDDAVELIPKTPASI